MKSASTFLPTTSRQNKKNTPPGRGLFLWVALFLLATAADAQNYTINTLGNVIDITDNSNNSDVLLVLENGGSIEFNVTVNLRTYSLNGGAVTNMPAVIPLASVNSITINTKGGNDNVNFGLFTLNTLPNLTVNGGTGDDAVSFFDDITFKAGAALNVDLQDDDAPVGIDNVVILANANLLLSGAGTATVKVSKTVVVNVGGSLITENGALTVEANQQAVATTGGFVGVTVDRGLLQANGAGNITVKGKGGATGSAFNAGVSVNGLNAKITSTGGNVSVTGAGGGTGASFADFGVAVQASGLISTGVNGSLTVTGFGGTNSTGNNNGGVLVNTGGAIASNNGNTLVTGIGGGKTNAVGNYGVILNDASSISAIGTGAVSVLGTGGTAAGGNDNYGVYVNNTNSKITSSGGNVNVTGQGGGTGAFSLYNYGVYVNAAAQISSGGTGQVTVMGTGGASGGNFSYGVFVEKVNSTITSAGGNVGITGQGGGSGSSINNFGVNIETSAVITAGGSGTVTVNGTGGSSTGNFNAGVVVNNGNTGITSSGGNVSVTGAGGGTGTSSNNVGVYVLTSKISPGGNGTLTVLGTGGAAGGLCYGVWVSGATASITSNNGNVSITGNAGGSGGGASNFGVLAEAAATITAGGAGTVTVNGQGGASSGGTNHGVTIKGTNTKITSSGGAVNVTGQGGSTVASFLDFGVSVESAASITSGGTGLVTIMGTGGASGGVFNSGVSVSGAGSTITSSGGNVNVTGLGGGSGTSGANMGVAVQSAGVITVGGNGTLSVTGNGGTNSTGSNNAGILANTGGSITSNNGNVTVIGQGGGKGVSAGNYGVYVTAASTISAGGTGTVSVQGTGGSNTVVGDANYGVLIENTNSKISSSGGSVSVTGQGGGSGVSAYNYGVYVNSAGLISAGGASSTVLVQGTGGASGGNYNYGVFVEKANSKINSSGGNVSVTGQGGGSGSSTNNMGVFVDVSGTITAGLSGTVTVNGTGGLSGGGFNVGVFSGTNATITSSGGNVSVTGMGGGSGTSSNNLGVYVFGAGSISAGVNGTVTVNGTGGSTGGTAYGVNLNGTNSRITSSGGNVSVVGKGGGAAGFGNNHGVIAELAASISAGGTGTVSVEGTGGAPGGATNYGVYLKDASTAITSSGGNVGVTGIEGGGIGIFTSTSSSITTAAIGGNISLLANSMDIAATSSVSTNAGGSTTIRPYTNNVQIDLGTALDPIGGPLGLSDAELDRITTGTLAIGDASSGAITVSAGITRSASTVINLTTSGAIHFNASALNSAGGHVNLVAPGGVNPSATGIDVSMGGTGTLDFAAGDDLNIPINGTTVDVQYRQLNVVGMVDITGVDLVLSGGLAPVVGQTFIIVNNDGADPIMGTFNGLAEGATLVNFLGTNFNATISYIGGTGNDAVLTVICSLPAFSSCPGNQTVNTDPGFCSAVVNYTATVTGDPTPVFTYAFTSATVGSGSGTGSGSAFNKGTTGVTITATNNCGAPACAFSVVVSDMEPPTVACPSATTIINTDAGAFCSITIPNYVTTLTPTDNCPGVIAEAQTIPAGSYSTGVSDGAVITVYYTATDVANNTKTCTVVITVNDDDAPTFTCPTPTLVLNTTGAANCSVTIPDLVAMVTDEADNCALKTLDPVTQSIATGAYNGVSDGSTIPVVVTVTDNATPANSTTCTVTFTVNDDDAPTFTCPTPTLVLNTTGAANCSVTIPDLVAMVTDEADNCALKTTNPVTQSIPAGTYSGASHGQPIPVMVTVTDNANPANSITCTVTLTVIDDDLPSIVCPSNISKNTDPNQCSAVVTYANPTFSDNCSGASIVRTGGLASGSQFPRGVNMVNWKATDAAGNTAICNFTVTVNDVQAPTITCPLNSSKLTDPNLCTAVVTYNTPTVTDNCTGASVVRTGGLASGTAFPKGPTVVTWKATDAGGLIATCSFTVTVSDGQAPAITCPANQTKNTDLNLCTAVTTYTTPTFIDNCAGGSVAILSGLSSGAAFPKGQTTVVWRATDGAGLTKTCTFRVTVNDTQAPAINCPANQVKTTEPNLCTASATYANATFTDNCAGGSVVKLSGLNSGSAFPKGVNSVVFKATDAAGNQALCTMTVTVTDAQSPVITCPANMVVTGTTESGICSATVVYSNPTTTDNCGILSSYLLSGLASYSVFPQGVTTNVWKATDHGGLTATCAFTVTVNCGTQPSGVARDWTTFLKLSNLDIRLAPNPATTEVQITVEGLEQQGAALTVLDAQGRVVWQQKIPAEQTRVVLNWADRWTAGVYLVVVKSDRQSVAKRLVVVKP